MEDEPTYKVAEIKAGDWCIFRNLDQNIMTKYILGNVLAFRYINGKTNREKQYSLDFAPVYHEKNSRGVEVLASWYSMDTNGIVIGHAVSSFINIEQYVVNLLNTVIKKHGNDLTQLSKECRTKVENELQRPQS